MGGKGGRVGVVVVAVVEGDAELLEYSSDCFLSMVNPRKHSSTDTVLNVKSLLPAAETEKLFVG